jgi:hypothetical protein
MWYSPTGYASKKEYLKAEKEAGKVTVRVVKFFTIAMLLFSVLLVIGAVKTYT